jgi:hypothetical protein
VLRARAGGHDEWQGVEHGREEVTKGIRGSWVIFMGVSNHWCQIVQLVYIRLCLDTSKFKKFYKISRHIESLDTCMEH